MKNQDKVLYAAMAKVIQALAHPTRPWMTEQLADDERCVCEFVDAIEPDFSTISKQLSILQQAGNFHIYCMGAGPDQIRCIRATRSREASGDSPYRWIALGGSDRGSLCTLVLPGLGRPLLRRIATTGTQA
ncbi:ArsR family transcriptional regulator [Coraliomargarita sp. W4R53]